jgi:hypothetical protein
MTKDLTLTTETLRARDLNTEQYELIRLVATALHQSRYYADISSADRAAYKMARAWELGFPATAAPDVLEDIQGKLTLKPMAHWAKVLQSGLLEELKVDEGDDYCEVLLKRRGLPGFHGYKFTRAAAIKADLVKQGGAYDKWERNMYYWRALGFALDRVFPDVGLGLKPNTYWGATPPAERVSVNAPPPVDVATGEVVEGEVV